MTVASEADVVVVGMGPGGEDVAERLAEAGLDVIGIEAELVGGECPYWACVPSKMMTRAGDALAEALRVNLLAGSAAVTPNWSPVVRRIRDEATDNWDDTVAVERFEAKGGRLVRGRARLSGEGRVLVDDIEIRARRALVLATGSVPVIPPIPGLSDVDYWTNRGAIATESVPASLAMLGGGAVGTELAQVFARFGSAVTIVESAPRILSSEEPQSSVVVEKTLAEEGLSIRTGSSVVGVERRGEDIVLRLDDGSEIAAERLLVAVGRRADLAALGVGAIGLDENARAVPVDDKLRAAPGVWAVGDLTGKGAFTHVAMYQARIASADILGRSIHPADYSALPRVTFTDPEVGSVGLTEAQARTAGISVRVGATDLASSSRGFIHKTASGLIKLVEDKDRGVLVGATAVGPAGGEILGLLALAVHARVPTETLRAMILAFPTFHRAVGDALENLVRDGPS